MHNIQLVILLLVLIFNVIINSQVSAANILIIESYHETYSWDVEYKKGITENIKGEHQFDYFQMDTKRLAKNKHMEMVEGAWQKYLEIKPDIVVLGDDNALKYLGPRFKNTSTPVVYLGINNSPRNYELYGATNITGVLERPLLKRSILYLNKLIEEVQNVLILFDASPTSIAAIDMEFDKANVMKLGQVTAELDMVSEYSLWQKKVLSAEYSKKDYIIVGLYHTLRDQEGNHVEADKILKWTSENSPVPVFGFWDFSIGENKAIGGLVLEGYQQGYTAAQIINQLLAGDSVDSIRPKVAEKGRYLFSRQEIEKHQITIPTNLLDTITWLQ
ncbi:ABC transporter substrate binding protein [uncultured Pseudoalteromonas sp.]|uniref:ABC transporter substrate-binding protein n=1 Tax=uncultured Pseudoalteromonas sp. TaxID=114053 RepID=UPI0030F642F1